MSSTRNHTTTRLPSMRTTGRKSTTGGQKVVPPRPSLLQLADELDRLALRREKVLALRDRALADRARSLADRARVVASRVDAEGSDPALLDEWRALSHESAVLLDRGAGPARS